ncbi:MAG: zf-HC2 domain-containing protein [Gemmatimonadales bacterium]|nr:MAG: zf-HC2 domain-containing protein [Gemmatimonadales bacterium]
MTCSEFRRLYSAYRDEHEPSLAAAMDDHLEVCPPCAAFDRAVRDGVDALRGASVAPSDAFDSRLEARLATREPVPDPFPPRLSPAMTGLGAALLLTLAGLAVRGLFVTPSPAVAEPLPLVIARAHLVPGIPFVIFDKP